MCPQRQASPREASTGAGTYGWLVSITVSAFRTPPRQESPLSLYSEMKMLTPIFLAAMKTQMMHLKVSGTEQVGG